MREEGNGDPMRDGNMHRASLPQIARPDGRRMVTARDMDVPVARRDSVKAAHFRQALLCTL